MPAIPSKKCNGRMFMALMKCVPAIMNEPRAVETASQPPPNETYPRLGDVPMAPKDFTPQRVIDKTKDQMVTDRSEAQAMKQQADNLPPLSMPAQHQ